MDVVQRIGALPTMENDQHEPEPTQPVYIESISVTERP
jgi:hypothetical protein